MAITKEIEHDRIEVITNYKKVQCREATVIKEDGVEISRIFHRYILHPDEDISGQTQEIQDICNVVWTDEVKAAWTVFQEEHKTEEPK